MAIFGFGKSGKQTPPSGDEPAKGSTTEFSPERAEKFFERARTVHETESFEYAMQMWLDGLRQNPLSTDGLEGFFKSVAAYRSSTNKKGVPRDVAKAVAAGGRGDVDRYLGSLLEWGCDPENAPAAVRTTTQAAALGLREPGRRIAELALKFALADKRPRKDLLVQLMQAASKLEAFEVAVRAGESAVKIDPTDAKLAAEVRNMAAQATMSRGGYDAAGQSGGFRANVRDASKQQRLEAEDRMAKTEETLDSLLAAARSDYESRPNDKPAIQKYVKFLLERGRPEDEAVALDLLNRSYEQFNEYRFRQLAGEVRMRQARRRVSEAERAAEASPDGASKLEAARRELLSIELAEFEQRVAAYPTDLALKFELGRRYQDAGRHEDAIAQFQEAKTDVRLRAKSLYALGISFGAIEFNDEAIDTFRAALDLSGEQDEQTKLATRYGLMSALMARASEQKSLADAEEATKLASSIAIQQINYRDIRARRDQLKALVASLRG